MSAHSPWLKFVTGLLDSPKTEVKGVFLVRGLWYEILSGASFDCDSISYISGLVLVWLQFMSSEVTYVLTCIAFSDAIQVSAGEAR